MLISMIPIHWIFALTAAASLLDNRQIARQILQERCHGHGASDTDQTLSNLGKETVEGWVELESEFLDVVAGLFYEDSRSMMPPLVSHLRKLLVEKTLLAFSCPVLTASNLYQAALIFATVGHHNRSRVLLQIGNMFKLQSISQWWGYTESLKAQGLPPASKRFETAIQADYSIALAALAHKLNVPPMSDIQEKVIGRRRNIQVHSICSYNDDPTSNTGVKSDLPEMAPRNHRSYADHFGYKYIVHNSLVEGRENMEAHYSKMMVILRELESSPDIDWLMFIDCDAFFTDFTTSLDAIVDTFADDDSGVNFIVAEDSGGINTGVFMVRGNSEWSKDYLRRVSVAPYTTAWDQSQFFWEAIRENLFSDLDQDFQPPQQIRFIHQRHLNAFVPPASVDWMAYEWQPGDFIRHFAGCPWQEKPCLAMMKETVAFAEEILLSLKSEFKSSHHVDL